MHIKTIASAIALSASLGFGSFVYAQDAALPTSIGGQEISAEDAQRVKVACDDLQTEANQAVGTEPTEGDAAATNDTTAASTDEAEGATAAVGAVDMDSITLESCIEAGFLEAPAM